MPLIYPEISTSTAPAIVSAIRRLKAKRYNHDISRAKFLHEYEKLRDQLNETEEYKALRRLVVARAKGICERCEAAPGSQMCHKIGVSFRPDLALRKDNVYWGCAECHQLDHPDLRLT